MANLNTIVTHNAVALTKDGSSYGIGAVELSDRALNGMFSVAFTIAGTGTVTLTYELSLDGTLYLTPSTAVDIGAALASGGASDILSFQPEPAKYIKILATEDNVNPITSLTVTLLIQ